MKFYPSDWRSDPMLRLCSLAARGLWMEMMCLMHEAEPYGSLLVNGTRFMQVVSKELTKFERCEWEFRKKDRDERAKGLPMPVEKYDSDS
jgi:hypothetical protein